MINGFAPKAPRSAIDAARIETALLIILTYCLLLFLNWAEIINWIWLGVLLTLLVSALSGPAVAALRKIDLSDLSWIWPVFPAILGAFSLVVSGIIYGDRTTSIFSMFFGIFISVSALAVFVASLNYIDEIQQRVVIVFVCGIGCIISAAFIYGDGEIRAIAVSLVGALLAAMTAPNSTKRYSRLGIPDYVTVRLQTRTAMMTLNDAADALGDFWFRYNENVHIDDNHQWRLAKILDAIKLLELIGQVNEKYAVELRKNAISTILGHEHQTRLEKLEQIERLQSLLQLGKEAILMQGDNNV